MQKPEELLRPYVWPGMIVLEPGPGMGFFTLPLAEMIGEQGRVIAVDVQLRMLKSLRRRAAKAGLAARIEMRQAVADSLRVGDLAGSVDLVLAFAVVHEVPSAERFFREAAASLKPGGRVLFVEPAGHVTQERFAEEVAAARSCGLALVDRPQFRRSQAVLLAKQRD
jgi:ubiquinone/menaquinone biosynthesis C-methylase UbiE